MKDFTFIAVLLDRSGSMGSVQGETISGFNHFLKEQQAGGKNATLTLVQFDSQSIDTVYDNQSVDKVVPLNTDTFQPRGMTPLLDALGQTIIKTGDRLSGITEDERPDKIVFVIITDGEENASREFSKTRVKDMIEHQTNLYQWQFVYLGANQDAIAEAAKVGINMANAASYNVANMQESFAHVSANVRSYRIRPTAASLSFKDDQRKSMTKERA